MMKTALFSIGLLSFGIIAIASSITLSSGAVDMFDIQYINKTETFVDGELQAKTFTAKESLNNLIVLPFAIIIFLVFYIWAIVGIGAYYDREKKKFVLEDN